MKNNYLTIITFLLCAYSLQAQSTAVEVYNILQAKCATCHSNASPAAGLDLEGSGTTINAKIQSVYNNTYEVTPANNYAADKGYKYLYPGRVDQSFLFRTINDDFDTYLDVVAEEGNHANTGAEALTSEEKELLRQWINFGAPKTGTVVDPQLISDYYNGKGAMAFPDGPPAAPAASEGFQIRTGPYFLAPGGEVEYFQKYELDLPEDVEVHRVDVKISNYSHHLLIYDFQGNGDQYISDGLRLNADHSQIGLVAALQEATDLRLPENTAFRWKNDIVLDLNSHYINYSANSVYLAEAYINVYTQPTGTAAQEMHTRLIANTNIYIPNTGAQTMEEQVINTALGDIFMWGMMGHTHKYGTSYKVYKREGGQETDPIYDASCGQGIPGCVSPYFDYQHIPMRYFDELLPVRMSFIDGLIHKATWVNDGPSSLSFGPTSDDEMMVLVLMYVESLEGLTVATQEAQQTLEGVSVYPNPMEAMAMLTLAPEIQNAQVGLYDMLGRQVRSWKQGNADHIIIEKAALQAGIYTYRVEDGKGRFTTGKLVIN